MKSQFSEDISNFNLYITKVKYFFNPENIIIIKMEDLIYNKEIIIEKILNNI